MTKIRIPDLTDLYESVKTFVLEHQEPAGFIYTQNSDCDTIWTMVWDGSDCEYTEYEVKALRVKNNSLECIYDRPYLDWSKQAIACADDDTWYNVRYDDSIFFLPTIFSIAENIEQYVDEQRN